MQERLNSNNSKRDMRKKFVKSSRPTYKKRIRKAQQGIKFVSYNALDTPTIDYKDITNPINPFSEYNYNTTYDKPEALVVPVRDTNETDVVVDKPTVEPVINKPVASNPVTTNSTWKSPYNDRSKWVADLTSAYKRAGITNDNAIKMLLAQDALESGWGKSAQGKFNFGNLTTGAKWKGDYVDGRDKNAKGEAIKQRFRSYNSMDEYAADKIQFLKRLYDFNENDDINKFTAKLTGANKGKRRYAEATNYAKLLTGVYNGIPKGQNGLVVNRDAIKGYQPDIPPERIKRTYSFGDLGGEPAPDITPEQRWQRQKRDRTIEDWKGLLRGLNNTAGRAASLASLIYGGGWAATRLLNGNKSSVVGQALSKYVLPFNTYDTIGDVGQLIEDPSISNAAEVGIGIGLGKWRDFSKTGRQITELGSQALNAYNSFKAGGIIKYQNSGKLVGRYSDSKGEEGLLAELPEVTVIGNKNHYLANKWNSNNTQSTSEMPVRAYVNNNGQLDYARQYNPSAGYVSGADPLGEFVVGNAVLNKPLQLVGRAAEYGLAKAGNNWARARIISKTINQGRPTVKPLPNNAKVIPTTTPTSVERTALFNTGRKSKISRMESDGVPKDERNQPIKSDLDWKNWSKGGPISKVHLAEYNRIEKEARYNNNWLMTEDSQPWSGDSRTWVQLMSKDGSRFKKGKYPSNNDVYYHGIDSKSYLDPERTQEMYLAKDFDRARTYTNTSQPASPETKGGVLHLGIPNTVKPLEVDANGARWYKIPSPFTGEQASTDAIKNQAYVKGYDAIAFNNVLDNGAHWVSGVNPFKPTHETVINKTVPRKSLIWNNGDFNINNPNIYKTLSPFLLTGGMTYRHDK